MKSFLLLMLAVLLLTLTVCSSVNGQQQQEEKAVNNDIINDYDESESLVTVIEPQIEEPVCPFDYILLESSIADSARSDGEEEGVARRNRKRRQLQQQESSSPPIRIIRQADDDSYVEFTIQNTTSWLDDNLYDDLPKHIFTILETGPFGSQHCIMDENLSQMSSSSSSPSSSSEILKAHCFGDANFATIRTYVRYSTTADTAIGAIIAAGNSSKMIMDIPKCCQDPYASSNNNGDIYAVIRYVYKLKCTPSCDNPEEYFDGETNGTGDDDDETDDLIIVSPSASPSTVIGSSSPTIMGSLVPTETQVEDCSAKKKESSLLRDTVTGSLLNGPHWGSRHGWAWPAASNNGCTRYGTVDDIGSGANAWPCYVNTQLLNRILQFKSSYFDINFEVDNGMKTIITLPDGMGTDVVSLYPSGGGGGGGGSATTTAACTPPNDYKWNDYPLRLVRSGRYLHHWYAETVGCNGATSASGGDTRIEIKVTPDCVELYMVSTTGAALMNWITNDGDNVSSTNGFAGISYCVKCDTDDNDDSDLSGCSIVKVPIPADCCPLSGATIKDGTTLCGTGFSYETCDASQIGQIITTPYTEDISVSTTYPTSYPIIGDGHSYEIRMPRGSGGQMNNDIVRIKINNNDNNQKWKKVKLKFHIGGTEKPKRITGVNGILRDPITKEPTGIHVQMSKNWHENRNALYNSYWWDGIAHVRVPPGVTELELYIAYQLDGKPWPPTERDASPFTFNLIKSRQNNAAQNTASIELGLPTSFIAAVDAGQAKFREGDYLSADIEVLVPPRQTVDYFGKSQRLKTWLAEADVDQDYKNGWKVIAKEAMGGDALKTTVFQGILERKYHPRVHVDCSDEARFNIQIPDGMPGILPVTIAGVGASDSFPTSLLGRPQGKMWRYVSGSWKEFGVDGNYQLEKDVVDNSYTFVYSLSLEFESDPVGDCEQFYFGVAAPSDSNPSCDAP